MYGMAAVLLSGLGPQAVGLIRPLVENPAYLDPGSGSYLLQLLIGGLLGGLFVLKVSWHRVTSFFSSLFSRRGSGSDGDDER